MLKALQRRELEQQPIRVGLVGVGSMGLGIAHQISMTPGMQLKWVYDIDQVAAQKATEFDVHTFVLDSLESESSYESIDVLVEASNCILEALNYCESAIRAKTHVVLMNAEVDLAFGPYLHQLAQEHGVVVTSDAGDQHGVLATMIEEIQLWGLDVVQAGNIKGFLNRYATSESLAYEAKIRNLNPIQCCAYTDGSKLNIEMAVLANGLGFLPSVRGMQGPKAESVSDVLDLFDFDTVSNDGVIDYVLGAEPGGGVYVVAKCRSDFQMPYLNYYKVHHSEDSKYYVFYRPYHLCHIETPKAIYKAVEEKEALLEPSAGRMTEVYAYAKKDLTAGDDIAVAIGSDEVYGMVGIVSESSGLLPQVVLESEGKVVLRRGVTKDSVLKYEDVEWSDRSLVDKYLCASNQPSV